MTRRHRFAGRAGWNLFALRLIGQASCIVPLAPCPVCPTACKASALFCGSFPRAASASFSPRSLPQPPAPLFSALWGFLLDLRSSPLSLSLPASPWHSAEPRFYSGPALSGSWGFLGRHLPSVNRSYKMAASIYSQNCLGHGLIGIKLAFLIFSPSTPTPLPICTLWLADHPVRASFPLLSQPRATHLNLAL